VTVPGAWLTGLTASINAICSDTLALGNMLESFEDGRMEKRDAPRSS